MLFIAVIGFFLGIVFLLALIDQVSPMKLGYEKWLEEELKKNPDYINWLKVYSKGKYYKLGLRILIKIKKEMKGGEKKQ